MGMEPVVPGLWRIPLTGRSVNSYVWTENGQLTLIDCGYPGSGQAIMDALCHGGHDPHAVREIVLTHGDVDHMGGVAALRAATGARVVAHELALRVVEGLEHRPWGPGWQSQFLGHLVEVWCRHSMSYLDPDDESQPVLDGEVLPSGWQVLHTPGHTPGHIALYRSDRDMLLTGDAVGQRRGRLVGARQVYANDPQQASASALRLARLQARVVCPGHRAPIVDAPQDLWRSLVQRVAL